MSDTVKQEETHAMFRNLRGPFKEVVKLGKPYPISARKEKQSRIFLENDFGPWVPDEELSFFTTDQAKVIESHYNELRKSLHA